LLHKDTPPTSRFQKLDSIMDSKRVDKKCSNDHKAFQDCVKKQKGVAEKCYFFEARYLECAASVLCPEEGKLLRRCNAGIKGSGSYDGRKTCEKEMAPIRAKLQQK